MYPGLDLVNNGERDCIRRRFAVDRLMVVRPRIIRPPPRPSEAGDAARGVGADTGSADTVDPADAAFDEATYLRAFPDIAEAVRRGVLASGLAHYRQSGRAEGRLEKPQYRDLLEAGARPVAPTISIDTLTISTSGSTLMTGWSDDRFDRLTGITLQTRPEIRHDWESFPRLARSDVERSLDAASGHRFGFLLVAAPTGGADTPNIDARTASQPVFRFASGVEAKPRREPSIATDADLRDLALAALPMAAAGDPDPAVTFGILDQHVGVQIAAINRLIVEQARSRRLAEHFGPRRDHYAASVITMARGGADQIVPWLALTGMGAGAETIEFIVVVVSADQFEPARRAARIAEATLGVSLTLVFQVGGDPAGTGEDAAVDVARSGRLIFMDQSVFPRDPAWASRHAALLDGAPKAQTQLMGGMLYHAGGSLYHAGYYFDQESSVVLSHDMPRRVTSVNLKSEAHPVPAATPGAHPAPGVSAAFLSIDRAWFETLGGVSRHYCRAIYEDVDLCLRSLKRGVPAWVHPLRFWYLERHGPHRMEPSKGGAILNSWLLHRQWDSMIVPDLLGQTPKLLNPAPLPA